MRRLALALVALLAVAACADPVAQADRPTNDNTAVKVNTSPNQNRVRADKVDKIAATVPQSIRDQGEIVLGTTGTGGPPLSFRADDDKTVIGVEPDIAQLVADVLGLKLRLETTSWENLFLSVESGQYDAGFSNITVTEERKDKYDFATYRVDTIAFEVRSDSQLQVKGPKDIAGLKVAVQSGTNQEQILLRWDAQNKVASLAPIQFQYYTNNADYYLALKSGRVDVYVGPNPTEVYHSVVSGDSKIVGQISGGGDIEAQIAAMTKKGSGLARPIADALNALIQNGKYKEVLHRWNLDSEAVPTSNVNPQGLPRK
jgi:polar amino acid transport system substrate-binding protein